MPRPRKSFDPRSPGLLYPAFGEAFDAAVRHLGLDHTVVAQRVGVTPQIISRYRRGLTHPTAATLAKINAVFGLDIQPEPEAPKLPNPSGAAAREQGGLTAIGTLYSDSTGQLSIKLRPELLAGFGFGG